MRLKKIMSKMKSNLDAPEKWFQRLREWSILGYARSHLVKGKRAVRYIVPLPGFYTLYYPL